jgi:hypothetical protein
MGKREVGLEKNENVKRESDMRKREGEEGE